MAPELLIFDCDGVLVDSEPISNRVLAECLTEIGLAMTPEEAVDVVVDQLQNELGDNVKIR